MSFEVDGRHHDVIEVSVIRSGKYHHVLSIHKDAYLTMGSPNFVRFLTSGEKVGIKPFNMKPSEPYNRVTNQMVSLSWYVGTKEKKIRPGEYVLKWNPSHEIFVFEPETERAVVGKSHNRFGDSRFND